jgi:hypothetical protein
MKTLKVKPRSIMAWSSRFKSKVFIEKGKLVGPNGESLSFDLPDGPAVVLTREAFELLLGLK